mgnify:CR=1 FL=1
MIHKTSLKTIIEHPETMNEDTVAMLRKLTERYPYFHAARILYLRALYQTQSVQFDAELRHSAPLVPNRNAIFRLIEERNYVPREEKMLSKAAMKRDEEESMDMTGSLIDNFLNQQDEGRIVLQDVPDQELQKPALITDSSADTEIFTEALARIYIKQGKFERAIEIIRRLSLKYPKKNRYFADQIRFLEKLIINNKNKKE